MYLAVGDATLRVEVNDRFGISVKRSVEDIDGVSLLWGRVRVVRSAAAKERDGTVRKEAEDRRPRWVVVRSIIGSFILSITVMLKKCRNVITKDGR